MAKEKKRIEKKPRTSPPKKKRCGLRLILSLLIILGAAGTAFYFGWVSYQLEEGQVGVVHTKSHGYDTAVIRSGEFAWMWQALLPTNLTMHTFDSDVRTMNLSMKGTLPSGKIYAAMADTEVNFDWSVQIRIRYEVNPQEFPSLVAEGYREGEIDNWYAGFESKLSSEMKKLVTDYPAEVSEASESSFINDLERQLAAAARAVDERIVIKESTILEWSMPDTDLYIESRRLYLELMELRSAVLAEVEDQALRRGDVQGNRLELLEEYGRILNSYPVLLDLFALEGNPGSALLPPATLE